MSGLHIYTMKKREKGQDRRHLQKRNEEIGGRNGNDMKLDRGPRTFSKGRDGVQQKDSLVEGRRAEQFSPGMGQTESIRVRRAKYHITQGGWHGSNPDLKRSDEVRWAFRGKAR